MDILLVGWVLLSAIHLGIPAAYFAVMRSIASKRDYRLNVDGDEEPSVSIVIPTYNEGMVMERKLRNIAQIEYPREKMEVIVVDGASTDDTVTVANDFFRLGDLSGRVIEESERRGKASGLNSGLAAASGELVCLSDAECQWDKLALRNAVKYFADPSIGSVSGIHQAPLNETRTSQKVESSYRSVYRTLRIAESKIYSTPIAEGEIQLFRRNQLTAFDPTLGGDDTAAALSMVKRGLRAISAEDVVFFEPTPPSWRARLRQKIRRGQHVMQAFMRYRSLLSGKSRFSRIVFPMEFFLYIVNPIIFVPFAFLTVLVLASNPLLAAAVIGLAALALLFSKTRTVANAYIANNLTMMAAIFQEIRGEKQLVWTKINENRANFSGIAPVQKSSSEAK
jgi:poly-beta-1,6-N-acetyl-D-glucosamine synthase